MTQKIGWVRPNPLTCTTLNPQARLLEWLEPLLTRIGVELIPRWRMPRLPQARYLRRLFATYGIDCVFDVGANEGQYARFLRQEVGYRGLIVSFEPAPEVFAILAAQPAEGLAWERLALGLGERETEALFNLSRNSEFGSFLKLRPEELASFQGGADPVGQVKVPVRRLDGLFDDLQRKHGFRRPYLKVDTQGYDRLVLEGAGEQLGAFVAIQSEASVVPIYEGGIDHFQLIEWVRSKGFECSAFHPNNEGHFPRLIEFDCHFINRAQLRDAPPAR